MYIVEWDVRVQSVFGRMGNAVLSDDIQRWEIIAIAAAATTLSIADSNIIVTKYLTSHTKHPLKKIKHTYHIHTSYINVVHNLNHAQQAHSHTMFISLLNTNCFLTFHLFLFLLNCIFTCAIISFLA